MFRFGGNGINYTSKLTQDNAVTIDDLVDIYFEIYTHGYYSAFSAKRGNEAGIFWLMMFDNV